VPPRAMFWAQMLGTVLASLMNLITANWLLSSRPGICHKATDPEFSCPQAGTFYSASVIWGVISPNKMFGPDSIYNSINYFFIIGFLLPIPFYYLKKAMPNTWLDNVHIPVLLAATAMMPPAQPYLYPNWLFIGLIFQFFVRRYRASWHLRFTYILSAGLDSGTAIFVLAQFFIFTIRGVEAPSNWWGVTVTCDLDGAPWIPADPLPNA
ncbi:hypothetical protein BGZ83_002172, partial [Gryganskiella cystojenkinii]